MAAPSLPVPPPTGEEVDDGLGEQVSKEIFSSYEARSLPPEIQALPHPGDIAEPASLAAVPLPHSTFPLAFPPELIASGKLSAMQLEACLHACTKHLSFLPSGERAGFFLGDGAGTGKGRQLAAIILDSYLRGRVKSIWISTSTDLYQDATRDMRDLGAHLPLHYNLQSLDRATVTPSEGVMFVTYATLTSSVKGKPRLQQLIEWVGGPAWDGVLVFDEAHKSKHFSSNENQGTKVATAVVELQRALPLARVVYASATGVSEVSNMAYLGQRLGLFGVGTAFPDFEAFLASLKRKGVSFLEMLAIDLKGAGFYVARGLSFRSAEFLEMEVALNVDQIRMYDEAVAMWTELRAALAEAVVACGGAAKDPFRPFWGAQQRFFKLLCVSMKVPAVAAEARAALDAGCAVVIGLQSTGEAAADALNLVPGTNVGFVSVCKEILLSFVRNHFPTEAGPLEDATASAAALAPAPSDSLWTETTSYEDGSTIGAVPPPPGSSTAPPTAPGETVPAAAALKAQMMARIEALDLPPNFLDALIDALGGKHAVAEMTGRKARVVRDQRGSTVYELRARPDSAEMDSLNIKEKEAFMAGRKLVAIVSDAASTGISLHADARVANQRRRVHITIELPWSADKAIQQLGRSHRSNQTSAPVYKLVFTDLGGERRFAAAVARRLQSLGALTRGDRRAASGLDLATLNYDSPLGRKALRRMYDALVENAPLLPLGIQLETVLEGLPPEDVAELSPKPGREGATTLSSYDFVQAVENLHSLMRRHVDIMGIGLATRRGDTVTEEPLGGAAAAASAAAGAGASKDTGDVRRFLNRLLAVPVHRQRLLFNYFQAVLDAEIKAAKKAGSYTEGVSDLPGQGISRTGPALAIWVDPATGQNTLLHTLSVDRGVSFEAAAAKLVHDARHGDRSGFYRSRRPLPGSGRRGVLLALQKPGASGAFSVERPNTGPSFFEMDSDELFSKYSRVQPEEIESEWNLWYEVSLTQCTHGPACQQGPACPVGRRLAEVTLLSGSVVRIWDALERVLARHEYELNKADRTMRIVRVEGAGEGPGLPLIGLRYPGNLLAEVVAVLAAEAEAGAAAGGSGGVGLQARVAGRQVVEEPAPVVPRLFKKAFTAPKTVLDFFKPAAASGSAGAGKKGNGGGGAAAPAAAAAPKAGAKKRPVDKAGSLGAMFAKTAPAAKRQGSGSGGAAVPVQPKAEEGDEVIVLDGVDDNSTALNSLCAMGFSRTQAERALRLTQGSVERAAEWLLTHP